MMMKTLTTLEIVNTQYLIYMYLISGKDKYCTAPDEFLCKNNACINETLTCNAENDCGDFSDEHSCG